MSLRSIFLCALVGLFVWYVLASREIKERAVRAAFKHCESLSLRLLDQTVVLARIRIGRAGAGSIKFVRDYKFDFSSTGNDRYEGRIRMVGARVDSIHLEPHRVD